MNRVYCLLVTFVCLVEVAAGQQAGPLKDEPGGQDRPQAKKVANRSYQPIPGDEVILFAEGTYKSGKDVQIPVVDGYFAYLDYNKVVDANDVEGLMEMTRSKKLVFVDRGTKVRVLKTHRDLGGEMAHGVEIRILEGPYDNNVVWVTDHYLTDRLIDPAEDPLHIFQPGEAASFRFRLPNGQPRDGWVSPTRELFLRTLQAIQTGNAYQQMLVFGSGKSLKLTQEAPVEIVDYFAAGPMFGDVGYYAVRVLDGALKGRTVYVNGAFIGPPRPGQVAEPAAASPSQDQPTVPPQTQPVRPVRHTLGIATYGTVVREIATNPAPDNTPRYGETAGPVKIPAGATVSVQRILHPQAVNQWLVTDDGSGNSVVLTGAEVKEYVRLP